MDCQEMASVGDDLVDAGIQRDIGTALVRRQARREKVDRFEQAWKILTDNVDSLIREADAASAQFGSRGGLTSDERKIAEDLNALLRAAALRDVQHEISAQAGNVTAIGKRIRRSTVNIGVIGQTQSGKSTFLRTITDIGSDVIPKADDLNPTTSARSRFRNDPGPAHAVITLLSPDEFLGEVVAPLHQGARCPAPPPTTLRAFAGYPYRQLLAPSPDGKAPTRGPEEQSRLRRLRVAQGSLADYEQLLGSPEIRVDNLADLKLYVAYPTKADPEQRYHAVRDVRVFCAFPMVDCRDLELIDLPGMGEAGLEIDRRFLDDLKNDVDILLHLTRPRSGQTFFDSAENISILATANEARMGVERGDFTCLVINEDTKKGTRAEIANVMRQARAYAADNQYQLVSGDASDADQAREKILGPVLGKLAGRLEDMDADAATAVTDAARAAAGLALKAAGQLIAGANRWQVFAPSEDDILRTRAKELRNAIAADLLDLAGRYQQDALDGKPVRELEQEIAAAGRRLDQWASARFTGPGWLSPLRAARAGDPGETPDDWCTVVRQQIRREFSQIDASMDGAIGRLHQEIAAILRARLPEGGLVPEGEQPFRVLLETTREGGLNRLQAALANLIAFRAGYGNISLRIGGPIVAQITYEHALTADGASMTPEDRAEVKKALIKGTIKVASGATGPHGGLTVPLAIAETAIKVAPIVWEAQFTDHSPEGFSRALSDAFRRAVDLISERMRAEACELTATLAFLVSQFYDDFCRTPEVEWQYARLCAPIASELWPDAFDDSSTRLADGLSRLIEQSAATDAAAREVITAASAASDGRSGR
jgi:hypothetical protein